MPETIESMSHRMFLKCNTTRRTQPSFSDDPKLTLVLCTDLTGWGDEGYDWVTLEVCVFVEGWILKQDNVKVEEPREGDGS